MTTEFNDAPYKITYNQNHLPQEEATGFLMLHDECVGGFDKSGDKWKADIHCMPDGRTDVIELGLFDTQLLAAKAVWRRRYDAFSEKYDWSL